MSPICFKIGITLSASTLKPSNICAPDAMSFNNNGVFIAYLRMSFISDAAFSSLPSSVLKLISSISMLALTWVICWIKLPMLIPAKTPVIVLPNFENTASILLPSATACVPIVFNDWTVLFASACNLVLSICGTKYKLPFDVSIFNYLIFYLPFFCFLGHQH